MSIGRLESWWREQAYSKGKFGLSALFLFCLSLLYRISSFSKKKFYVLFPGLRIRVSNPLVVIGNLTVGGTGKTPLVLRSIRYFLERDERVHLITRGYGAKFSGSFARYREEGWDRQGFFGDELEACIDRFPSIDASVGKRRGILAREVCEQEPKQIILMDDALQYWRLEKDFCVITIHGSLLFGNGNFFPWGPLRESPLELRRASAVVIHDPIHPKKYYEKIIQSHDSKAPLFLAKSRITFLRNQDGSRELKPPFDGLNAVVSCGIAHPKPFIKCLSELGIQVAGEFLMPDHHRYRPHEQEMILKTKDRLQAEILILTEKDKPRWSLQDPGVFFARQEVCLDDEEGFFGILDEYVDSKRSNQ